MRLIPRYTSCLAVFMLAFLGTAQAQIPTSPPEGAHIPPHDVRRTGFEYEADPTQALIQAVLRGDAAKLGEALAAGADPRVEFDSRLYHGSHSWRNGEMRGTYSPRAEPLMELPLWVSANVLRADIAEALLAAGADPYRKPTGRESLLDIGWQVNGMKIHRGDGTTRKGIDFLRVLVKYGYKVPTEMLDRAFRSRAEDYLELIGLAHPEAYAAHQRYVREESARDAAAAEAARVAQQKNRARMTPGAKLCSIPRLGDPGSILNTAQLVRWLPEEQLEVLAPVFASCPWPFPPLDCRRNYAGERPTVVPASQWMAC